MRTSDASMRRIGPVGRPPTLACRQLLNNGWEHGPKNNSPPMSKSSSIVRRWNGASRNPYRPCSGIYPARIADEGPFINHVLTMEH